MDSLAKLFSRGTLKRSWRPKAIRERAKQMAGARAVARLIKKRNRDLIARQNRLNRESRSRNQQLKSLKRMDTRRKWCAKAMESCKRII